MKVVKSLGGVFNRPVRVLTVAASTAFASLVLAGAALATESASESALKEVATKTASEGSALFLIVIVGIVSLLALIIAVNLGIHALKRYAK